ncbi:DUF4302 domain-containing protein [Flavobacterium sp. N1736]|uniref:DUF4302 domain-containing protein n=1 Tax=Flavobacterium sp. N1736 TaxID=2986823 RepID=UPI0022257225|nr:DUF4302 domain-containing protein [Flavobacterium sp. N1736]
MKVKHIYKYLILALVAVILVACTSTEADPKFDQTPLERLNGQKKELNDLLLSSSEGWKAVYYTDSTQLGGWTHLFKFLPDGKVDMASDFDDGDTSIHRSQYDIQLGSAVSLVFTTANRIHLLSQSDMFPTAALVGKGFLGDFQFYYYGEENGEIIFRTNRSFQELRFVKAKASDWTDLSKNTPIIEAIAGDMTSPLFRLLVENDGTTTTNYEFDFNPDARFGTATSLAPGSEEVFPMSLSYTATGAVVKPAVVVKGQKLTDFTYDSVSNTFVATGTGGVSATIKYTNAPPRLTDDYKRFVNGQPQFVVGYIAANLYTAPTTSDYFRYLINKVNATLPAAQSIARVQIYFNTALNGTYIQYQFNGGKAAISHLVTTQEDAVNKTIKLTNVGWTQSAANVAFLKPIDDELLNIKGLYIKREDFTITYSNTIYTLTSASSSFRMTTYQL